MSFPKLSIIYPDESAPDIVDLTPQAKVRWEREFNEPFMSMLIPAQIAAEKGEDPFSKLRLEHLLFLGWAARFPKSADAPEFDDWCLTVERVVMGDATAEDEGDEPVPLDRSL